jgi:hypothetical protein
MTLASRWTVVKKPPRQAIAVKAAVPNVRHGNPKCEIGLARRHVCTRTVALMPHLDENFHTIMRRASRAAEIQANARA